MQTCWTIFSLWTIFSFRFFLELGQWMLTSSAIRVGLPISKISQYLSCIPALSTWQFQEAKPNNNNKKASYLPVHLHQVNITGEEGFFPLSLKAIWQLPFLWSSHFYCLATRSTTKSSSADEELLNRDSSEFPHFLLPVLSCQSVNYLLCSAWGESTHGRSFYQACISGPGSDRTQ